MPVIERRTDASGHPDYEQQPQRRLSKTSRVRDFGRRASKAISQVYDKVDTRKPRISHKEVWTLPPVPEKTRAEPTEEPKTVRQPKTVQVRGDYGARQYNDKLDLCSETEIINDCEALNNKINDVALSLIDEWSKSPVLTHKRMAPFYSDYVLSLRSKEQEYLKYTIGSRAFKSIRSMRSSSPSPELQNLMTDAIQAIAVHCLCYVISGNFCPGIPSFSNTERNLRKGFEHMLCEEPQAAALRWRALAYTHLGDPETSDSFTANANKNLASSFSHIFMLAGERATSPFLSRMRDFVEENELVQSALRLSRKLKTSLFSVYLDVFSIPRRSAFDDNVMESVESGAGRDVANRHVLYTVELGIHEVPHPGEQRPGRILLKPKVVLETSETLWRGLREIFEMAGVDSPKLTGFADMIVKIVNEAAALSKRTKTEIFSQSVEVVIVEPGSSFDKGIMIPADERDAGEVKSMIQLTMQAIDNEGKIRILQMPEVLLVDA